MTIDDKIDTLKELIYGASRATYHYAVRHRLAAECELVLLEELAGLEEKRDKPGGIRPSSAQS